MTDTPETVAAARLRFAVYGAVDDETRAVEQQLFDDPTGELSREIEGYRKIRTYLAVARENTPPKALFERTLATIRAETVSENSPDSWYQATVVRQFAGVRSVVGEDINLVCAFRNYRLNAVLHGSGRPDRYALTGQLVLGDSEPVGNLPVTLLVDLEEAEQTQTDEFGEFEFAEHAGERFGIRVGVGAASASIELKSDSAW